MDTYQEYEDQHKVDVVCRQRPFAINYINFFVCSQRLTVVVLSESSCPTGITHVLHIT